MPRFPVSLGDDILKAAPQGNLNGSFKFLRNSDQLRDYSTDAGEAVSNFHNCLNSPAIARIAPFHLYESLIP